MGDPVPSSAISDATVGGLSLIVIAGGSTGQVLTRQSDGTYAPASISAGDVVGPASATDNAVARFDTTTGKLIQHSSVTIDDSGNISCGNVRIGGTYQWLGNSDGFYMQTPGVANHVLLSMNGVEVGASSRYGLNSSGVNAGSVDVAFGRAGVNIAAVYTTATGSTLASFNAAAITASALMCAGTYTVGTLPSAAANAYKFATVSDSSVTTFGSTVAGSGSSKVMVFSNGTNWTVCAA